MTTARPRIRWASIVPLAALGLLGALLLGTVNEITRERIDHERQARVMRELARALPAERHDNDLTQDWVDVRLDELGTLARVYRARLGNQPSALLVDLTTPRGYSGDIRLLVALEPDGQVLRVDVLQHRETPGLGDRIERGRTDWLNQFTGRQANTESGQRWAVDKRGGDFDGLSNATITVQAVIEAVEAASRWAGQAPEELWTRPSPAEQGAQ
ncbi:MAG: RnfABCDGE type electron transport complex subunit G [Wenzhouxiangella sp.]